MESFSRVTDRSFIIKRGLWDSRPRILRLHADYIEFDNQSASGEKPLRLLKEDIKEYRFGIVWIRGLKFYIGRQYQVFVHASDGSELKIDFLTYYGFKKNILNDKYREIVNTISSLYFTDSLNDLGEKFQNGESIIVCGVELNQDAVILEHKGLFRNSRIEIPWEDVKTRSYQTYYAIYSSKNPADINKSYKYLDDYNAWILRTIMENILTKKQKTEHDESAS